MSIILIVFLATILFLMLTIPSIKQKNCIRHVEAIFKSFEKESSEEEDDDSLPENWLEDIEKRTMRALSEAKRADAMPIVKATFRKSESLLAEWHKMPDLVNNYGDTERVFKVAALNIERSCKDYIDNKSSFDNLRAELDKQIDGLRTIIGCLSDLAGYSRQS